MDGEPEPEREVTRVPTDADLVSLARELNRLGVAAVVIGRFAINRLGFVRATEDIDPLVARDKANQSLLKKALEILPDGAIRELGDDHEANLSRNGLEPFRLLTNKFPQARELFEAGLAEAPLSFGIRLSFLFD
jgi:hypothetical protein